MSRNNNFNIIFFLFSLLTLFVFVLVFLRESNKEYIKYQKEVKGLKPGINQIILSDLKRIDRCTTCHATIDDPSYKNAPQPLKAHPGKYLIGHTQEKFGCTVCHGGQGLATTYKGAAHQELKYFEDTLLPQEFLEARCGVCHKKKEFALTPNLSRGRKLLEKNYCQACHNIPGFTEERYFGPSWDGVGNKVKRRWLVEWLKDPHSYLQRPRMPQFRLSENERAALVEYLLKLKKPKLIYQKVDFEMGDSEKGGKIFRESRCITCHSVKGKGGTIAPELGMVAEKVRKLWLYNFLIDPHFFQENVPMVRFNFSPQDALDLVAYISEEFRELEETKEDQEFDEKIDSKLAKKGEEAFKNYGCYGCHSIPDFKAPAKIGPDLKAIGKRHADQLDFGKVNDVVKNLPNWIFLKIKDPKIYNPKAKMPNHDLSDEEIAQLTIALLSLREAKYPVPYIKEEELLSTFSPHGKVGRIFSKYRCLTCHQIYGKGGTISQSPLDREGSQVKKEWLFSYLKLPYGVKTNIVERMPLFRISDDEAKTLAEYMNLVFVDDSIPEVIEETLTPEDVEKGKKLFNKKGCIACHILGPGGGYVGPDLNNTGNRLKAGWIISWLKDPQKYKPDTIEPNYGFSEEEARALAAYLITFRGAAGESDETTTPQNP